MTTTTSVYQDIVAKIEETDLTISTAKQLLVKTLRGNLSVGSIDIRLIRYFYDDVTDLEYIKQPTNQDFIDRFITASLHQSLLQAGYEDPDLIYNTSEFREYLYGFLLDADWACEAEFDCTIYFHILPVELNHPQPVSLFFQIDPGGDEFTVDGISYFVLPGERYTLSEEMMEEFESLITLYHILSTELSSDLEPQSISINLNFWPLSQIDLLDEVLWDGLFSYNTSPIYGWLATYPDFIM